MDGLSRRRERLLQITLFKAQHGQTDKPTGELGHEPHNTLQQRPRLGELPPGNKHQREIVEGFDKVGMKVDRLAEASQRLFLSLQEEIRLAEIAVRLRIKGVDAQRLFEMSDGLVRLPQLDVSGTDVVVGFGGLRIETGGFAEERQRLVRLAVRLTNRAEQTPALDMAPVVAEQLANGLLGPVEIARLEILDAALNGMVAHLG